MLCAKLVLSSKKTFSFVLYFDMWRTKCTLGSPGGVFNTYILEGLGEKKTPETKKSCVDVSHKNTREEKGRGGEGQAKAAWAMQDCSASIQASLESPGNTPSTICSFPP